MHAEPFESPASVESEQALLGSLLLDNNAWDRIADVMGAEDFFRADHRHIFLAIENLVERGKPADVVTVLEVLKRQNLAEQVGGLAYLGEIANTAPSSANARRYAEIIRERAILRRLIAECNRAVAEAASRGQNPAATLDGLMEGLSQIAEAGERAKHGPQSVRHAVYEMLERVELASEGDGQGLVGTPSGLKDYDKLTLGLHSSDMIVVAGRPSMGKTAFALTVAAHVAVKERKPVLIFSMEMPANQLVMRMTSSLSAIESQKIRLGKMDEDEWSRFSYASGQLAEAPIDIDETPSLSPTELRARARRIHRRVGGLGLIVIDYIQLMQLARAAENRNQEISAISRAIKALAKELNVPIIALSQLNRSVEQRGDKRPLMSDLRESGAIEQDADLVAMLYRDEYYDADSQDRGIAEVLIGKHRNGPTGTVRLAFDENLARFRNLN